MIEIIPAIMPESYADLHAKAERIKGLARVAQIDVMDGIFVPSQSWPHNKHQVRYNEVEHTNGEQLPFSDELAYEIDLMVDEPERHVEFWLRFGVRRLIFHIESTSRIGMLCSEIRRRSGYVRTPSPVAFEIGVAINTATPLSALEPVLPHLDFVQCMGIADIGYQGQPFDVRVLEHIRDLRADHPGVIISVDGGVSLETAPRLIEAGAIRLVSGSAIFESDDPARVIMALQGD